MIIVDRSNQCTFYVRPDDMIKKTKPFRILVHPHPHPPPLPRLRVIVLLILKLLVPMNIRIHATTRTRSKYRSISTRLAGHVDASRTAGTNRQHCRSFVNKRMNHQCADVARHDLYQTSGVAVDDDDNDNCHPSFNVVAAQVVAANIYNECRCM
jgi:hypothetical protein